MDKRYFVSLVVLGFLVLITWSLAPSQSPTAETADSETTQAALLVDTAGPLAGEAAVPIIGLDSGMETATATNRAAFDDQIGKQIQLDMIPDRMKSDQDSIAERVPTLPATFTRSGPDGVTLQPIEPARQDASTMPADEQKQPIQQSFSMPNVQQPLSTLPNDRRILKPIAKLNSPFSQEQREVDGPAADPVFQKFASRPAPKTPSIHRPVSAESSKSEFTRNRSPVNSLPIQKSAARPARDMRLDRSRYIWHVVEPSQSLQSISLQYSGDDSLVEGILSLNSDIIEDPTLLPVGKAIRIPIRF